MVAAVAVSAVGVSLEAAVACSGGFVSAVVSVFVSGGVGSSAQAIAVAISNTVVNNAVRMHSPSGQPIGEAYLPCSLRG